VSKDRGRDVPTTVLLGRHFASAGPAVRRLASTLARGEGLPAHAASAEYRLDK